MANLLDSRFQLRVNCPDAISDIDALAPVQSQYAASPRITSLLVKQAALLDPGRDLMLWYDSMFNPKSAEGIGLDNWGRIVGVGRMLWMQNTQFFGFAFQNLEGFDQAPFWIESLAQGQFLLSDEAFRFLVFHKAMANIGESSMAAINALLDALFAETRGHGACGVLEVAPMHVRAVFSFYLTAYEQSVLEQYGLLDRPAGVGFSLYQYDPGEMLGFAGQKLQNFDNGVFTPFTWYQYDPSETFGFAGQELQNFDNSVFTPFAYQIPA